MVGLLYNSASQSVVHVSAEVGKNDFRGTQCKAGLAHFYVKPV